MKYAHMDDVLAVIEPGEHLDYSTLLERMKAAGRETAGVGGVLGLVNFVPHSNEIVTWREPYWDDEIEGGWAAGTLYIKRKPL